ncbi:MAG: tRNA (guanosine(37)-N1)-methyltransferase TrmD [Parcubacteria group bacterium]|nr:tRNA (guanosine(37)-N1)-methyltransferase TrmD [Parcubacteria group bacterium]
MTYHIITLFPEIVRAYTDVSIIGRAQERKKIKVRVYNTRDFTRDKHKRIDGRPYGGGPGMVMQAEPILKAVKKAIGGKKNKKVKIVLLSPNGKQFTNKTALDFSKKYTDIVFIAGRYEGIDARVKKILSAQGGSALGGKASIEEWSVGPYIVTGGELPSLIMLDAITRQISGVLGKDESVEEKRIAGKEVYTRPESLVFAGKKYIVPKVLRSGHHEKIEKYRRKNKKLSTLIQ